MVTSSLEADKDKIHSDPKGKGKAKEVPSEENTKKEEVPIEYYILGGKDEGTPRSKAEENATQKKVS